MFEPKGIIPAMATPFNPDETINEQELRRQVNRFIEAGVHALFCLGTNGEFYALRTHEKIRVMEIVREEAAGRLPLYAGTGCITTAETVELTTEALRLGHDAVSIISPYFAESSQEGLCRHFRAVAEAVDIPVILYNNPARTNVHLEYQTVARLAQVPNIVGIKDSSGNFDNILRLTETTENFSVISGNDSHILWTLLAGGRGGISGIANLAPRTMVEIYIRWEQGDLEGARRVQDSIRPLRDLLKLGNPNSIVKRTAVLMGQPLGPARSPFRIEDEQVDEAIRRVLSQREFA